MDVEPASIRLEAENSLRRLGAEVIDLYQMHWPPFGSVLTPGKTTIDHVAAEQCDPDEWLEVQAWDES